MGELSSIPGSDRDLLHLLDAGKAAGAEFPRLYQYCGTEDFLYASNQSFLSRAQAAGVSVHYTESRGDHQWKYWDKYIYDFLTFALHD